MSFSEHVGIQDAISTEILALAKACNLCMSNPTLIGKVIEFASDSKVAVSWVNGRGIGSMKHVQTIYEIRSHLTVSGQASVVYCSRASNSYADMLAKKVLKGEGTS